MKMDKNHKQALESCKDILKKNGNLSLWIAFGIPDEDRIEIIKMAKRALKKSA